MIAYGYSGDMSQIETGEEVEIFPNAPITEAVLEFQLRLEGDPHLGRLALVQDGILSKYPQRRDTRIVSGGIQLPAGSLTPLASAEAKQTGYQFISADGRQLIQARMNAYGFSRLNPYQSWKSFRREAAELWDHFKKIARPERITRIGLRYINRIEIPLPIDDFGDYVLTKLDIAPGLPSAVSAMAIHAVVRDSTSGAGVIINEAIDQSTTSSTHLPLIFDIDAFKEVDLDPDSVELWKDVGTLRKLKDEFFFKSFTDKAKELFR